MGAVNILCEFFFTLASRKMFFSGRLDCYIMYICSKIIGRNETL